jgi:hypothetical protein
MTENRTTKVKADPLDVDQLSEKDWEELGVLFRQLTLELQDNIHGAHMNGTVFDVLPTMDMLLSMLEDAKQV